MQPEQRDQSFLWDMLDSAKEVVNLVGGRTLDEYKTNRPLRRSVEREIEIIGEAAKGVSEVLRSRHARIPWARIIAQRNVLAHEYGEVVDERIWNLTQRGIPELVEQLEQALEELEERQ